MKEAKGGRKQLAPFPGEAAGAKTTPVFVQASRTKPWGSACQKSQ